MKHLREQLFKRVKYMRDCDTAQLVLETHQWGMAFEGLDAADIYELTIRALIVNFFSSSEKMKKLFNQLRLPTEQKTPPPFTHS